MGVADASSSDHVHDLMSTQNRRLPTRGKLTCVAIGKFVGRPHLLESLRLQKATLVQGKVELPKVYRA